jgi:ABC-2 type transport system ATP-binding protein
VIEVSGLIKDYPIERSFAEVLRSPFREPRHRALNGVDLRVAGGEIRVLIGPNGSGKSTCLLVLAGIVRANGGVARIGGQDAADARGLVGAMFGERGFHERLRVRDDLRFFGALRGMSADEVTGRIGELGALELGDLLDKPFRFLSTGQRARVALARALLHRPKVLLLDEPTRSLDPRAAARVRGLVRIAAESGVAVLFSTHDLAEAASFGHRASLLAEGRVVAEGSWAEVEGAVRAAFDSESEA